MRITLRQLSYLIALERHRSFSRAAEAVHVTQPALSMQIRELETELGLSLIERRPRDIRLTRAGRMVLARAEAIEAELRALQAEARRGQGSLNLGVIPTIAPYLLPRALPALRASAALRLREARTEALLADLNAGRIDAAIIATPAPECHEVPLGEDRFLLAGTPALLALNRGLAPDALDPGALLLLDEGHCLADQALALCGLTRAAQSVDLGASSLSTLCGLVGQGMGLTLVPEIAASVESRAAPGLALMRFAQEPARTLRLVGRKDSPDAALWFEPLAQTLRAVCADLLAEVRKEFP
ncbi:hydrogen peroxide-inducible genes activator [Paenirhodobacter sp. CAU 1674]|uniref:hydrogen peroxide-inducible genes activator n=1 Tax=Paenirhodobacter sp. CAU 1674 TaxID=3032596 RepID=UPI0023DA02A1|nr:hydrogen peroxide-inducible genes activator [Paenirhodobacter sp. CAU 1674]MDF2139939.1 LysR substrate-binding domain-containing protein [Paenirhodobacter sp. CAU 1674]